MFVQSPPVVRGVSSWPWLRQYLRDPLGCLSEMQRRFGNVFVIGHPMPFARSGRSALVAIGGDHTYQILSQPDLFRPGGQILRGPKGSAQRRLRGGIFAMYGDLHRAHRRLMQPPFLKPAVAGHAQSMLRLIDDVIDHWQVGDQVDMYREMRKLSNWVAASLLFGDEDFAGSISIGTEIEEWLLLDSAARNTLAAIGMVGLTSKRLLRQAERLEKIFIAAIETSRRKDPPGGDVLSILVRAHDAGEPGLTQETLIAHAAILYAASFETTANVLAWTLFLVAQHPEIAMSLYDEVRQLNDWPPDVRALDELPMLDGVLREAMRLLPPVAYTFRTPTTDVEVAGYPLHPGDKVIISSFLSHRDPRIFDEPKRFNPQRWTKAHPSPYEYMPFSAGPRLCLGYSFATLELKLTIARIMQRFRLSVVPGAPIDAVIQLTLRPAAGIPMTIHPTDGGFKAVEIRGSIGRMIDFPT